jgi:AraC family transcriptional regulator, arabinose operon regulatory protein
MTNANCMVDDLRISKILKLVESDPSRSVQELAGLANLSSSRLCHLFKSQTGKSLKNFLSERRLEKAATLLRNTEMRVKEISYAVGYCQESNFVRAFRKKFNHSPNHYRRQQPLVLTNSAF